MTLFSRLYAFANLRENNVLANKKCFTVRDSANTNKFIQDANRILTLNLYHATSSITSPYLFLLTENRKNITQWTHASPAKHVCGNVTTIWKWDCGDRRMLHNAYFWFCNNLIWYVSLFLIGWKIASISVWMKKTSKPCPLLELLFFVTASTQSKLIGSNSSSYKDKVYIIMLFQVENIH